MRLFAFRGTRYSGDTEQLAAPPFDQIGAERQEELHGRHEHQFARLTRPVDPGTAAELLATWSSDGTTVREEAPCLYAYEIRLADQTTRRLGLCGLVALEPPDSGVVRPHESTVEKTIEERLGLLGATETDLEPILMLCEKSAEFEALLTRACDQPFLCRYRDEFGHLHGLHRIDDAETIDRFRQLLAPSPAWIADGHHRYRVASEYARRRQPAEGTAAAAKLAVITSLASPGLRIDPIHRAVVQRVDPDAATSLAAERTTWTGSCGADLATAVARAAQPSIGVCATDGRAEVWRLDPDQAPEELPDGARRLAAALVHGPLFERLGLAPGASHDGSVVYRSDPDDLFDEVARGDASLGVWLPPTSPELFAQAVEAGDRLPPKWTRFVPKLASGLVWCPHETEIL